MKMNIKIYDHSNPRQLFHIAEAAGTLQVDLDARCFFSIYSRTWPDKLHWEVMQFRCSLNKAQEVRKLFLLNINQDLCFCTVIVKLKTFHKTAG